MLAAAARLTDSREFRLVVRQGRKASRPRLVVYVLPVDHDSSRAGFIVSKVVGNSVVRHRVARRLRHQMGARWGTVPHGFALVVRALPLAAEATSAQLGADLDSVFARLKLTQVDK